MSNRTFSRPSPKPYLLGGGVLFAGWMGWIAWMIRDSYLH
jgi:hypothetical protein